MRVGTVNPVALGELLRRVGTLLWQQFTWRCVAHARNGAGQGFVAQNLDRREDAGQSTPTLPFLPLPRLVVAPTVCWLNRGSKMAQNGQELL